MNQEINKKNNSKIIAIIGIILIIIFIIVLNIIKNKAKIKTSQSSYTKLTESALKDNVKIEEIKGYDSYTYIKVINNNTTNVNVDINVNFENGKNARYYLSGLVPNVESYHNITFEQLDKTDYRNIPYTLSYTVTESKYISLVDKVKIEETKDKYDLEIKATVTNNSNIKIDWLSIEIAFFDTEGTLLGTGHDVIRNIEVGDSRTSTFPYPSDSLRAGIKPSTYKLYVTEAESYSHTKDRK